MLLTSMHSLGKTCKKAITSILSHSKKQTLTIKPPTSKHLKTPSIHSSHLINMIESLLTQPIECKEKPKAK